MGLRIVELIAPYSKNEKSPIVTVGYREQEHSFLDSDYTREFICQAFVVEVKKTRIQAYVNGLSSLSPAIKPKYKKLNKLSNWIKNLLFDEVFQ